MNMEKHFSEKEIANMNRFLTRFDRGYKGVKQTRWVMLFGFIFFAILTVLCIRFVVAEGKSCGMFGLGDVMSFYHKNIDYNKTYSGCELFVVRGFNYTHLCGFFSVLLFTQYFIVNTVWKNYALLVKCWQLLSSQKQNGIAKIK